MPRQTVQLEVRTAKLSEDFGLEYATRLFGEEAIASLPILQSGPNKGKRKGVLVWRKAATSGYVRECCSPRAAGQLVDAWIGNGPLTPRSEAVMGTWHGRVQNLAGSYSVLGPQYRAQLAAENARRSADWEAEKAEMMADLS